MGIYSHMSANSPMKAESGVEDSSSESLGPADPVERADASIQELAKKLDSTFQSPPTSNTSSVDDDSHFTINASTTRIDYSDQEDKK